jgi:hypothetical protein
MDGDGLDQPILLSFREGIRPCQSFQKAPHADKLGALLHREEAERRAQCSVGIDAARPGASCYPANLAQSFKSARIYLTSPTILAAKSSWT